MEKESFGTSIDVSNEKIKKNNVYKKRFGTSGVTGQLYETKLLSLILFRALKDKELNNFYLGNNLDDIGAFDDICLKFEFQNKTVAAFIQAKHRDDPSKGGITDSDLRSHKNDFSLEKYFDSYLKIKQKFYTKPRHTNDKMFTGEFDNAELCFIIYTSACDKISRKKNKEFNIYERKIKDLISTRGNDHIFQINYDENDINMLSDLLIEEKINTVVTALLECLTLSAEPHIIAPSRKTIDVLLKYQSFLIPDVLQIQKQTTEGPYEANINPHLYFSKDLVLIKLRQKIFENVLSKSEYDKDDAISSVRLLTSGDETVYTGSLFSFILNKTIGNVLIFNSKLNKIDLAANAPKELHKYRHDINKIPISLTKFREVFQERAIEKMKTASFRLPLKLNNNYTDRQTAKTIFNEEKMFAKQFFDKLFFFTREAKQNEVENILKIELDISNDHNHLIRMHCEAIFLKLHDKVQKWAMMQGNSYYLTNCCDFVEKSKKEIIDSPYITVLNFFSRNELRKYNIQFSNDAINKILNDLSSGVTNIVTQVKVLTCIKLMQGLPQEKCSFINLELIKNLSHYEVNMLYQELDASKLDTLVIIYDELDHGASYIFDYIISRFKNKIIIVSTVILLSTIKENYNFSVFMDNDNSLDCLDQDSQDRLLAYEQVIVQGQVVSLSQILFNEKCKDNILINDEIIVKILKNETLIIGNALEDEKYVSTKDYYLPRYLYRYTLHDTNIKVDSIKSLNRSVVVITAEPGMGKSTLLTHISIETKKTNPNCWIARINLLEHSSELFKWQKERRNIDLYDTMTLICKSELGNITGNFEFQVTDGVLSLKHCNLIGLDLLKLELIIRCYNNDALIIIFDGFDEICPHYKDEAMKLIISVMPKIKKQKIDDDNDVIDDNASFYYSDSTEDLAGDDKMIFHNSINDKDNENNLRRVWIASRPYDSILYTLELKFGTSFKLKPLSVRNQQTYYQKYFHDNIKLHELSSDQFKNIEGFFEFMSQYRRKNIKDPKLIHVTSIPLRDVYEAAVDHFRNDILYAPIDVDKEKLRNEWVSSKELLTVLEICSGSIFTTNDAYELAGIPLQMHVAANYFVNEIKDTEKKKESKEKWDLNLNTSDYYMCFLETKLKTIQLQEKNRRNIDYADERLFYERDIKEYVAMHKKLAYYAMFHKNKSYLRTLISRKELSAIKEMIGKIKGGKEKSGLIYRINRHNNVPMFVHKCFAEYYAVEHITDKLKLAKKYRKKQILNLIINCLLLKDQDGLLSMFDNKLKYDEELKKAISDTESKKTVFELLLEQNNMKEWKCHDDSDHFDNPYYEVKIEPAIIIAISSSMFEITMFLLNTLEGNLNEENIKIFVELTKDTFFIGAALDDKDDIITFVLDRFRALNSETLSKVLKGTKLRCFLDDSGTMKSNEDILKKLQSHARHLTTRYWYYDNETDQFNSFYYNDSLS